MTNSAQQIKKLFEIGAQETMVLLYKTDVAWWPSGKVKKHSFTIHSGELHLRNRKAARFV
jgi:hypothetical protein